MKLLILNNFRIILDDLIGARSWFDSFTVQNTLWLSVVEQILVAHNSEQVVPSVFGLYPSYVAGILKHVVKVNFIFSVTKIKNMQTILIR
jgi:hypothetical protein